LLTKLIPLLRQKNLCLAVIKHAHHDFEIDHEGKDSFELRKAGACQMLVSSSKRKALITEIDEPGAEASLNELIAELDHSRLDLILVEGFKREHFAKIELHRRALAKPFLHDQDADIIALATDHPVATDLPLLNINDPAEIVDFIYKRLSTA
jgi:molybdopterin-guanine dinucleotide biosynthesis protein MobB